MYSPETLHLCESPSFMRPGTLFTPWTRPVALLCSITYAAVPRPSLSPPSLTAIATWSIMATAMLSPLSVICRCCSAYCAVGSRREILSFRVAGAGGGGVCGSTVPVLVTVMYWVLDDVCTDARLRPSGI
jgi:hypothetical protein